MKNSKIKKTQLESLIRGIVTELLNEYTAAMSSSDVNQMMANNPGLDPNMPPQDAMTSAEKARLDRDAEKDRKEKIKTKETELQTTKKEMDYQKQKVDQTKRFSIPSMDKELKQLKGAQI